MDALHNLHATYGDRVAFLVVYIREAHPEEGWILESNRQAGIRESDPATDDLRVDVAQRCAVRLKIDLPVVVDGVDNAVASAYGGWPDRLYLVGRDGRIAFQGAEGPFGFKPRELEAAIEAEIGL